METIKYSYNMNLRFGANKYDKKDIGCKDKAKKRNDDFDSFVKNNKGDINNFYLSAMKHLLKSTGQN